VIVVDASVLANAIGDDAEDGSAARDALRAGGTLAAPDLVDVETAAILRRRRLADTITTERLEQAIDDLVDLRLIRYPTRTLLRRVFELRGNVSAYDACYIALAEALDSPLWTADRRLAGAPGTHCCIHVIR
jgi:predicted nucleic acid-binding protein